MMETTSRQNSKRLMMKSIGGGKKGKRGERRRAVKKHAGEIE